jgi:hypothetical protein
MDLTEKYRTELKTTLSKINKDLIGLGDSNFEISIKNINSRMVFLKNYKDTMRNLIGDEVFGEIEENLKPETKLIYDMFDNIIEKNKSESNRLLIELKIAQNKKKIYSYRSYDEY